MFGVGFSELVFILLVIFLLFGPQALPEIARTLGQALKILRRELRDFQESLDPKDPGGPSSETKSKLSDQKNNP